MALRTAFDLEKDLITRNVAALASLQGNATKFSQLVPKLTDQDYVSAAPCKDYALQMLQDMPKYLKHDFRNQFRQPWKQTAFIRGVHIPEGSLVYPIEVLEDCGKNVDREDPNPRASNKDLVKAFYMWQFTKTQLFDAKIDVKYISSSGFSRCLLGLSKDRRREKKSKNMRGFGSKRGRGHFNFKKHKKFPRSGIALKNRPFAVADRDGDQPMGDVPHIAVHRHQGDMGVGAGNINA